MTAGPGIAVTCAYLLGSIPTGYLITRRFTGVDVRSAGSGNVGATNVARVAGKFAGLAVLVLDAVKGTIAVTLVPQLITRAAGTQPPSHWVMWCGLAAVVGHDWPCWLKFSGGKGIATSLGVLLGAAPMVAGWCVVVWGILFAVSRTVSLSSIVTAVVAPLLLLLLHYPWTWILWGILLGSIAVLRHNSNIQRLLQGTEQKFHLS